MWGLGLRSETAMTVPSPPLSERHTYLFSMAAFCLTNEKQVSMFQMCHSSRGEEAASPRRRHTAEYLHPVGIGRGNYYLCTDSRVFKNIHSVGGGCRSPLVHCWQLCLASLNASISSTLSNYLKQDELV